VQIIRKYFRDRGRKWRHDLSAFSSWLRGCRPHLSSAAYRPQHSDFLGQHYESFARDIVLYIMEPESSIRGLFASAKAQRKELDSLPDPTTSLYQENLQAAIASLEECRRLAERISLFSSNEAEDDVASGDLQYNQLFAHLV